MASPGESVIHLFLNQGGRSFASPLLLPAWLGVRDLAAGDFDGDGRVDLAAGGTTNGIAQGLFDARTNNWHGIWAPKATPKDIVARLNAAVVQALADPAISRRFAELG